MKKKQHIFSVQLSQPRFLRFLREMRGQIQSEWLFQGGLGSGENMLRFFFVGKDVAYHEDSSIIQAEQKQFSIHLDE